MKYVSTRENAPAISVSQAILDGIAKDGGLYVPKSFPQFSQDDFAKCHTLAEIAAQLLRPFFAEDALLKKLPEICEQAFDFEVPNTPVTTGLSLLELFHGPTGAFKDFGARFLGQCISRMDLAQAKTILVATSGDTGGAVGCAFEQNPNAKVVILYPRGRVSEFQQHQLTCWGDNVVALEVRGDFDDCQRLVKQAFADEEVRDRHNLGSANSINIARLLPQMSYYAASALTAFRASGELANFIIPSGNMGNGMAALWARSCGLPIGHIHFACNANETLYDFFSSGDFSARPSIATIANAMDVGNPSNFERFCALTTEQIQQVDCKTFSDNQIRQEIKTGFSEFGKTWCPHTACAALSWRELPVNLRQKHWTLVATADPYKFKDVIEPLLNQSIAPPANLQNIFKRPSSFTTIEPKLSALAAAL